MTKKLKELIENVTVKTVGKFYRKSVRSRCISEIKKYASVIFLKYFER